LYTENIQKFVDYLYLVDELRLKLLLFMLWDIDNYVGNKDINCISYILDKNLNIFFIGFELEASMKMNKSNTNTFLEGIKKKLKKIQNFMIRKVIWNFLIDFF
jgi:hypothetical protein